MDGGGHSSLDRCFCRLTILSRAGQGALPLHRFSRLFPPGTALQKRSEQAPGDLGLRALPASDLGATPGGRKRSAYDYCLVGAFRGGTGNFSGVAN